MSLAASSEDTPRKLKRENSKAKNGKGPKPVLPTPRLHAPPRTDDHLGKYPPEVIDDIFRRVSHGETLTQACNSNPNYPHPSSVIDWAIKDPVLAQRYAHAREGQTARWADDIVDSVKAATPETANVVRLEIDAKKWLLARLRPAQYGDKVDLTTAGQPLQQVDAAAAIKALLDALPALAPTALPSPTVLDAVAVPVETEGEP
jgi:hypothetical protein